MIVRLLLLLQVIPVFAQTGVATNIFVNLQTSYAGITNFLTGLMYVLGIFLTVQAVMKLKKFGHRTAFMHVEAGMLGPTMQFAIGVGFLYSKSLIEIINSTFFGQSSIASVMSYTANSGMDNDWQQIMNPILGMVQIIGLIAFIRGFLILSKGVQKEGGQQPGQVTKGIVHVVGGILGINIVYTIEVVMNTFGLSG